MKHLPSATRTIFPALVLATIILVCLTATSTLAFKGMGSHGPGPDKDPDQADQQAAEIVSQHGNKEAVVARVNGAEITMGALMQVIREVSMQNYGGTEVTADLARQMRAKALEKLAVEELAYQRAVSQGFSVDPSRIDARVEAMIAARGGEKAFLEHLESEGKTLTQLKNEIRRFLSVSQIIQQEIDSAIQTTDEEINEAYLANKQAFATPEKVIITDIIFFFDPEDRDSQEKVLAVKSLLEGELGGDPKKLNPEGFVVQSGMDISLEMQPGLYEAAKKLEVGTVSGPLLLSGTFHLIKLEFFSPRKEEDEAAAKKIVAGRLRSFKRNKLLAEWRQNLLKDAKIEIVHELLKE